MIILRKQQGRAQQFSSAQLGSQNFGWKIHFQPSVIITKYQWAKVSFNLSDAGDKNKTL